MITAIRIRPLGDALTKVDLEQIHEIFFSSSLRQMFADEAERSEFLDRWLGRYLRDEPQHAFLALDGNGRIAGYVVGALGDPATDPRYADIEYFPALADLTAAYPAHVHINVKANQRNNGVGARLIEAFCVHATARGATGVHVVTGAASRNLPFYARNGFVGLRELTWNGTRIAMLGRRL